MKKIILNAFLLLFIFLGNASHAQEKGVQFETVLSLKEALAKAGAEKKYLFIDCYATWCGPCKLMDKTIFSGDSTAAFMNDDFISIRLQMDSTGQDKPEITSRYTDVKEIKHWFNIDAYPTFLFLTPGGKLIGRFSGATASQKDFIAIAGGALAYPERVEQFRQGKRDSVFLRSLALDAITNGDTAVARQASLDFVRQLKDPFDKANVWLMAVTTKTSLDTGFRFFADNMGKVDQIEAQKGYSIRVLGYVINHEEIAPALKKGVSWQAIRKDVVKKHPVFGDEIVCLFHLGDDLNDQNWKSFNRSTNEFMRKYFHTMDNDAIFLNIVAWNVFLHADNRPLLQAALTWARQALRYSQAFQIQDTYANILYKLGRRSEAIVWEKKALAADANVAASDYDHQELAGHLAKMNKNQPTW